MSNITTTVDSIEKKSVIFYIYYQISTHRSLCIPTYMSFDYASDLEFCFDFFLQVYQTWFQILITSKLLLISKKCRCMHFDVLLKRTVFPGTFLYLRFVYVMFNESYIALCPCGMTDRLKYIRASLFNKLSLDTRIINVLAFRIPLTLPH